MWDPTDLLDEPEQQLWREYERHEEAGLRKPALGTLAQFVEAVCAYPRARRKKWVEAACRLYFDGYSDPCRRIRNPLVTDLIVPVLIEGY